MQVVYGIDGRQKLDEYCPDHLSGCENSRPVDASTMLMPMVRFISALDPMWLATRRTIEERLVEDILVRRYEVEQTYVDGLPDGEGSFTACSFWFVECLAREGKFEKAQLLFESFWATLITLDCIQSSLAQTDNILAVSCGARSGKYKSSA